jgi:hypothetical protein
MPDESSPSPTAVNGRAANGRFGPGNRAGKGNPLNRHTQRIRAELSKAATKADIKAICKALVDGAKTGDIGFIREWLDRTLGKPAQAELLERIEALEASLIKEPHDRT